jgi:hypothetical protein
MIDSLNLLLIRRFESASSAASSGEFINHWLKTRNNYDRLQHECEKIWSHYADDPGYDAERAFTVLGKRFVEICYQECRQEQMAMGKTIHR